MGFRTLEISHAAEIHIKEGQLEIATKDGVVVVPIEDLNQIMVHGKYYKQFDRIKPEV